MPDTDFTAAILQTEVVVKDTTDGHIFYFPIPGNGTVSLHGARASRPILMPSARPADTRPMPTT
jgi:hypothetical protein